VNVLNNTYLAIGLVVIIPIIVIAGLLLLSAKGEMDAKSLLAMIALISLVVGVFVLLVVMNTLSEV
jgi:hypothetical protein